MKKRQTNKPAKLYYLYDQEADVFYLSQGKPSARDKTVEHANDVILRSDPKSGRVRGFTILNFSRGFKGKSVAVSMPVLANWVSA